MSCDDTPNTTNTTTSTVCCVSDASNNFCKQSIPSILSTAPPWASDGIIDSKFTKICSSNYMGKYLLMMFYPNDFTLVCPAELIQFSDRSEEFKQLGYYFSQ